MSCLVRGPQVRFLHSCGPRSSKMRSYSEDLKQPNMRWQALQIETANPKGYGSLNNTRECQYGEDELCDNCQKQYHEENNHDKHQGSLTTRGALIAPVTTSGRSSFYKTCLMRVL